MVGRMFPQERHGLPQVHDACAIQVQCFNGCASRGREADQERVIIIPFKVFVPLIAARMEKRSDDSSGWVGRGDAIVFDVIATLAGQRQIAFIVTAANCQGNDVFHRKFLGGKVFPANTVFAMLGGALPHEASHSLREMLSSHADMA